MGLGVVGFLMTTQVNLEGGYFRVHKLNSSHGRVRKEKQRERSHRPPEKHQLESSSAFRTGPSLPTAGSREAITSLDWGVNTNDSWN